MTAPENPQKSPSKIPMTAQERCSTASLASIFALRMLGLFLILPVFALEAKNYHGGNDPAMVGLAIGMYGLTQALFQLPLGILSDRIGRKVVIIGGLLVFAAGGAVAAVAESLAGLMLGRALQGSGAVAAAVTALLSDLTRDAVRTKAMAMVGITIGLMFSLALAVSPLLASWVGLSGIFTLTVVLALTGVAVVAWVVPAQPERLADAPRGRALDALRHPDLLRLNLGVFTLHTVQMAMWVSVPTMLVAAGLDKGAQWKLYLPVVVLAFLAMGALFALERRGRLHVALLGAIGLVFVAQLSFALMMGMGQTPSMWSMAGVLLVFFMGFNMLEASQPSLVSRLAPQEIRGAALGAYNTSQSLGLFAGGALGGALVKWGGAPSMFATSAVLVALWWLAARGLKVPAVVKKS